MVSLWFHMFLLMLICSWQTNGKSLLPNRDVKHTEFKSDAAQHNRKNEKTLTYRNEPLNLWKYRDEKTRHEQLEFAFATAFMKGFQYADSSKSLSRVQLTGQYKYVDNTKSNGHMVNIQRVSQLAQSQFLCRYPTIAQYLTNCKGDLKSKKNNYYSREIAKQETKANNVRVTCTTKKCGKCIPKTGTSGTIQSPNYPKDYGNKLNCTYDIEVSAPGYIIELHFTEFIVESPYDNVIVQGGKKLTGYNLPPPSTTGSRKMIVRFRSDKNNCKLPEKFKAAKWEANYKIRKIPQLSTTRTTTFKTTSIPPWVTANFTSERPSTTSEGIPPETTFTYIVDPTVADTTPAEVPSDPTFTYIIDPTIEDSTPSETSTPEIWVDSTFSFITEPTEVNYT